MNNEELFLTIVLFFIITIFILTIIIRTRKVKQMCADKKRRVRGTISNIHLKIKEKSTDPKEGNINFHDTINWENEMVVFQDSKPEELAKWKDEKFDFSSFDASLLYQLYKDKQLIVFEIEPENQSSPKIVSMEIVDE